MRALPFVCLMAGSLSGILLAAPAAGGEAGGAAGEAACHLGVLTDPEQPDRPRIALYRKRPEEPCEELVLDTGVPLAAALPRAAAKLRRGRTPAVGCEVDRSRAGSFKWEEVFTDILAPGFRGEMLLHRGRVEEALATFARGLPDPRSETWLSEAARKLPLSVASLLPRPLSERNLPRADSAITVLDALASSHPAAAEGAVGQALDRVRRPLLPHLLPVAGEEAAGLRMVRADSAEANRLSERIAAALADRDPAVRGAAAQALLLAAPTKADAVGPLSAALGREEDPGARLQILSALGEAGGLEAIRPLTHAEAPDLRGDALRVIGEFSEDASERAEALLDLLDAGAAPGEVVRRLAASPDSAGDPRWPAALARILPKLNEEDRARVPALICRVQDSEGGGRPAAEVIRMAGEDASPAVAIAAIRALRVCSDPDPSQSADALLDIVKDSHRPLPVRGAAAEIAGELSAASPAKDRAAETLRALLAGDDEASREAARAGLLAFGRAGAVEEATTALLRDALERSGAPPGAASEQSLRRLYRLAPGPVIRAIRNQGSTLSEPLQQSTWDLVQRIHIESEERSLSRFREALASPDGPLPRPLLDEMKWRADYWPQEMLDLSRSPFESSREERRIQLLELMIALGRHLPDDVLALLTVPDSASLRVRRATREAAAAVLARRTVNLKESRPEKLMAMVLDPLDAENRADGRRGLWLLAWENPEWRPWIGEWIREERQNAALPLRVELGRIAAQLKEMGPRRSWVWPPERGEADSKAASCLPDTCGDSAPTPSRRPRKGAGIESDPRRAGD